jgi:PPM family protein phosphatase
VEKDHPEIELKYLPPYQQKQVKATIAEGGLQGARKKVDELSVQASACKKEAQQHSTTQARSSTRTDQSGTSGTNSTTGTIRVAFTSKATATPNPSTSKSPSSPSTSESKPATAPTASPGPTLSEEEQKVVSLCGKQ